MSPTEAQTTIAIKAVPAAKTTWHKRREALWPFLLAGTITWCSGRAAMDIGIQWLAPDKFAHFAVYGALATAVVRNEGLKRWPLFGAWWAILLVSAFGLTDEIHQSFTIVRLFEWDDWVADTLGAAVAVPLYLRWEPYRRLLETPLRWRRPKPRVEILVESRPNAAA